MNLRSSGRTTTCSQPLSHLPILGSLILLGFGSLSLYRPGKFLAIMLVTLSEPKDLPVPSTLKFRFGFLNIILFLRNVGSFFLSLLMYVCITAQP